MVKRRERRAPVAFLCERRVVAIRKDRRSQTAATGVRKWKQRQRRCGRGQARGRERMGRNRVAVGQVWRTGEGADSL